VKSEDVPRRSPVYAGETLTPSFSCGLRGLRGLRLLPPGGLYCSMVVRFGVSVAAPVSREGRSRSGGER